MAVLPWETEAQRQGCSRRGGRWQTEVKKGEKGLRLYQTKIADTAVSGAQSLQPPGELHGLQGEIPGEGWK